MDTRNKHIQIINLNTGDIIASFEQGACVTFIYPHSCKTSMLTTSEGDNVVMELQFNIEE